MLVQPRSGHVRQKCCILGSGLGIDPSLIALINRATALFDRLADFRGASGTDTVCEVIPCSISCIKGFASFYSAVLHKSGDSSQKLFAFF